MQAAGDALLSGEDLDAFMPRIHPIVVETPLPVGPVNAYLLADEPVTLVDAGPKTPAALAALRSGFIAAGVPLDALKRIILTHGHIDHFGLAASLQHETGAEILAHPDDTTKFRGDREVAQGFLRFLASSGAPSELGQAVLAALARYRTMIDPIETFTPVAEGARISVADGVLEVLHMPGHSSGHICLLSTSALFAGDVLLEEISANPLLDFKPDGTRVRTLPLLIGSLRRLLSLRVDTVLPGHGEPFSHPQRRVEALLAHHLERKAQIFAMIGDEPAQPFDLAQKLFPTEDPITHVLALSEVIGHLDLLVEDGLLEEMLEEGRLCYRRAN